MAERYIHINGALVERDKAYAPLYDHGLLYGDGVFEGIRCYNGGVFRLDEHLQRLYYSTAALNIAMPVPISTLRESVLELCKENRHTEGYIRLTVTRGTGLGLDPRHLKGNANVYISTEQLALYPAELYQSGLTMVTTSTRLPSPQVLDPRIKCTGRYANNIQAKMEANRYGAGEGLMLNQQGYVCECTGDNIFVVKDGVVKTPPPHSCGLQGITRDTVIELARQMDIPVEETLMTQYDVFIADECFLTGTGAEVIPAVELDARRIGAGAVGPTTARLINKFRTVCRETGVAFS